MSYGFKVDPIIQQFTGCLNTLFLNFCGTQVHLFRVAHNHLWGFMNFVNNKLPRVTKSFINKSQNKLVKKSCGINFFKFTCFLKKFVACVNIAQLQSSIIFFMFCYEHENPQKQELNQRHNKGNKS